MSGSFGAQVVLDPASPAAQGARGGAASTIHGNTVARDLGLISNGLDPLLTAGPPNVVVPFSLNFMRPGWLDPGVTFTRASTATYTDSTGTIQTAATNAPRWDYAGGVLRGLLIEEARTNLFLNSATLVTQGVTVTAQAYTLSFYGTGTITKSGAATGALVGTGATQRVTQTFTPTAGTLTCTVTGSVTNAQIEAGSFATSWVSTAGATATRATDIASIPTASWFNASLGSLFCEFLTTSQPAGGTHGGIVRLDDGTGTNQLSMLVESGAGNGFFYTTAGGVDQITTAATSAINGLPHKMVTVYGGGVWRGAFDGTLYSGSGSTVPFPATRLLLGSDILNNDTWKLYGCLRRVQYWPRALSNAEQQAVTT